MRDSNSRPHDYESGALPTELIQHINLFVKKNDSLLCRACGNAFPFFTRLLSYHIFDATSTPSVGKSWYAIPPYNTNGIIAICPAKRFPKFDGAGRYSLFFVNVRCRPSSFLFPFFRQTSNFHNVSLHYSTQTNFPFIFT